MRTRHTRTLVSAGLGLIALACVWFYLAPATLGGSTSYVVTDGISMEPRFHAGDLALVRSQGEYRVGEIVAYRSRAFHTIVLHRIVGRSGSRYIFKGDNNNFRDFEHPARDQLIGSLWLQIPSAGAELHSLRSPLLIGGLVGVGTLLFAGAAFVRHKRRRGRQRRAAASARTQAWIAPEHGGERAGGGLALALGAVALLPFLALGALAFTRPATALLAANIPYRQSGAFAYSAEAPAGAIYPGNRARTGDPLFTHVLSSVQMRFAYRFQSAAEHSLAGTLALGATLASSSGWQTKFQLGRAVSLHGDRALVSANLDLSKMLALIRHVEATTAVGGSYTLTLAPDLHASGRLDGVPLHAAFSPPLKFAVNQLELQPILSGGAPSAGPSSAAAFVPAAASSLAGQHRLPAVLSLGPLRLGVTTARWIALGCLVLALCALLGARSLPRPRRRDEAEAILARYGRSIVPVERVWHLPELAVIDVADIESLVRIAERYERSILHEVGEDGEAFWVTDESGQFRYALSSAWSAEQESFEPESVLYEPGPSAYEPGPSAYESVPSAYEPQPVQWPPSEPYTEEQYPVPALSSYDALSGGAEPVSHAAPVVPWAQEPTAALPQEGWRTGYEAAETYAGSRSNGLSSRPDVG